ncbi:MAG: hypothetical protein ABH862_03240 [Candidatus Omnitrophota bacterium]
MGHMAGAGRSPIESYEFGVMSWELGEIASSASPPRNDNSWGVTYVMKREPKNYSYWKTILEDSAKMHEFMARGNERQKKDMKRAYKYWASQNKEFQQDLFGE